MPPSIASVRSSSAFRIRGSSIRPRKNSTMKNAALPKISSAMSGISGLVFCSAAVNRGAAVDMGTAFRRVAGVLFRHAEAEDEWHHEADQRERLGKREAEQHVLPDQ